MVARARGTTTNRNGAPVGGEPSLISMPKPKNGAIISPEGVRANVRTV